MRILLVEDEVLVADFIRNALSGEGYAVDHAGDGQEALATASAVPYHLIVLDVMLPGRDGLSVLKLLRQRRVDTPVLMLSARGEPEERAEGLNLGADDYLAKPFEVDELLARVKAIRRRTSEKPLGLLKVGALTLNLLTAEARRGDRRLDLTGQELLVLKLLMRLPERLIEHEQIAAAAWPGQTGVNVNTVHVMMRRLRQKIDAEDEARMLHTRWGQGYSLRPAAGLVPLSS